MAHILSSSCRYGVRAAIYLAASGDGAPRYVPIRKISEDLDISFHFLAKILQILSEKGLVTTLRGPNGGAALTRPGRDISVLEIVHCLDGEGLFSGCVLGLSQCNAENPCALHKSWVRQREQLFSVFSELTLEALARSEGATLKTHR